jgi:aspartate aminotransferase-like enzyme
MKGISRILCSTYNAHSCAIIPGSGTYAMEAVARQFGTDKKCLVIRNGYFSFRWSQIFQICKLPSHEVVLRAGPIESGKNPAFAPPDLETVIQAIRDERPAAVFAPHVETAAGIILPDEYITAVAAAAHEVGAVFVLDCIASGCAWVDMKATGVDVIISAPQKGWSGPASSGLVMLSELASEVLETTQSNSFCVNLKQWRNVMKTYEDGKHKYYTTMPTDALTSFYGAMIEAETIGMEKMKEAQLELGRQVRALLKSMGVKSVAADGFGAPGVVVAYSPHVDMYQRFMAQGMQIAGGVPLMCGGITDSQSDDFRTFRLGLFGLDKLVNIPRTVNTLKAVLSSCSVCLKKLKESENRKDI